MKTSEILQEAAILAALDARGVESKQKYPVLRYEGTQTKRFQ